MYRHLRISSSSCWQANQHGRSKYLTNVPVYGRDEDPVEGLVIIGARRKVSYLVSLFNLGFSHDWLFHDQFILWKQNEVRDKLIKFTLTSTISALHFTVLKQNIVRCYSNLKLNTPTRNCIGSLHSQDLCK